MKYRQFVLMRNTVVAVLIGGAGFGLVKGCSSAARNTSDGSHEVASRPLSQRVARNPTPSSPAPSAAVPAAAAAGATTAAEEPLSTIHRDVLELVKQPLTNGTSDGTSRKWRVKRGQIVIELRSDTDKGSTTWNRLKVDLDRDKKWDEAWDLVPGKPIKRRFSPADDGTYTRTYDLKGERWVPRKQK